MQLFSCHIEIYLNMGDIWNNCCALYILTALFFISILPDNWKLSLYYSKETTLLSSEQYLPTSVKRDLFLTINIFSFFLFFLFCFSFIWSAFMLNTFFITFISKKKKKIPCFKNKHNKKYLLITTKYDFVSDFYGFWWFHRRTFLLLPLLLLQLFSQNIRKQYHWCKKTHGGKITFQLYGWFVNIVYKTMCLLETTLFLVNSCTYLEEFPVCVKKQYLCICTYFVKE